MRTWDKSAVVILLYLFTYLLRLIYWGFTYIAMASLVLTTSQPRLASNSLRLPCMPPCLISSSLLLPTLSHGKSWHEGRGQRPREEAVRTARWCPDDTGYEWWADSGPSISTRTAYICDCVGPAGEGKGREMRSEKARICVTGLWLELGEPWSRFLEHEHKDSGSRGQSGVVFQAECPLQFNK